jgi:hypothetical protein
MSRWGWKRPLKTSTGDWKKKILTLSFREKKSIGGGRLPTLRALVV